MKCNRVELLLSILFTIISFGVYIYLFGYADRKIVFLYGHLGLTPFDSMTTGRYWMTGLLLSGFLAILYFIARLLLCFFKISNKITWHSMVKFSVIPLIPGILFIIMNLGEPKLTFLIAISSALALIIGMTIGFSVVDDLINDYKSTFIYLLFGLGLVPFLVLFRVLELPGKGILDFYLSILVLVILIVAGFLWLIFAYRIFKLKRPPLMNVIKGTLATGYIGLPVLHYLVATPRGIPYITSAENFFANNMMLRLSSWILLVVMVFLIDKLTKRMGLHN